MFRVHSSYFHAFVSTFLLVYLLLQVVELVIQFAALEGLIISLPLPFLSVIVTSTLGSVVARLTIRSHSVINDRN